jgi:hypothetical protein
MLFEICFGAIHVRLFAGTRCKAMDCSRTFWNFACIALSESVIPTSLGVCFVAGCFVLVSAIAVFGRAIGDMVETATNQKRRLDSLFKFFDLLINYA